MNKLETQFLVDWPLDPEQETKHYFSTTHRIQAPEETFTKFSPARKLAGITRLADITQLDTVGIPTYMAVRPQVEVPEGNITVYNGKGITKIQAKVSAMMEAFERHAAERDQRSARLASWKEIQDNAIHPDRLLLPEGESYEDSEILEWVCGTELLTNTSRWVPAAAVFCPYLPQGNARSFENFVNSNGLSSGSSLGEAIAQGLAEVIERDAESLAELSGQATTLDLNTIPSPDIQALIEKFHQAGISLVVKEVTSELGVPTFFAVSDDPETQNPILLCRGAGTHLNAEIALIRAITEVAQSRCTFISGSREDLFEDEFKREWDYHQLKEKMKYWYEPKKPLKDFRKFKIKSNATLTQDIQAMLQALKKNGFKEVIVCNLTHPKAQVPVVRVLVPGLEQYSLQRGRYGPRARKFLAKKTRPTSLFRPRWLKK